MQQCHEMKRPSPSSRELVMKRSDPHVWPLHALGQQEHCQNWGRAGKDGGNDGHPRAADPIAQHGCSTCPPQPVTSRRCQVNTPCSGLVTTQRRTG